MSTFRKPILSMTRQSGWKLAVIFGFSALLVIGLLLARANMAGTAKAAGSPTITSDKADYQPGANVTLTGAGWASNEAVHIFVNDSVGNTWSLNSNPDPTADTSGGFTYSFSLPSSFIANYTATATGQTSGTATTTFTDNICPSSPTDSQVDQNPDPNVGATFTTSSSTATYKLSTANLNPSGGIPGLIDYCVYTSPQPASVTSSYDSWNATNGTPFSFSRPTGNANVPLDGNTYTIGTATWSGSVPASQKFVLHVADPTFCQAYNGSSTCFVLPGSPQTAKDLTVSKTATPSFMRTFTWGITKDVDNTLIKQSGTTATFNYTVKVTHDSGSDSDWKVTGQITVTNPNDWEAITADVSDVVDNGGSCTVSGGTGVSVPKSSSVTLDYSCTYTSAPSPSSGNNTATATWDSAAAFTPTGTASGSVGFDFGSVSPKLVDDSVTVTDTLGGTLGTVKSTNPSPTTFTYSHDVTGTPGTCVKQDNTATFTTNTTSTTGTDSKTVTLCVGADLTVSKTAASSFTRTFKWGITKSVDQTVIKQSGTTATFNYTVSVTHDNGTDNAWQVNGTITATNPNDWEAVTTNVADAVDNGGGCTVTGGTGVSVPAEGTVDLPYTCTYASAPSSSSGTNTATATWDKATYFTPDGTATGTASVDFSTPTTVVDGSITVVDDKTDPNNPVTLGTADYKQTSPIDFTYALQKSGVGGTCTTYTNTATFTTNTSGKTGSASQSVQLCVAEDLGVAKDATPSFTRTFTWGIKKSVDQTQQNIAAGGTATFKYTVAVTHDAGTDSNWMVSGKITVSNPNNFEDIVAKVSDAIGNGDNCTVTGGSNVTVPAGKSVTLDYNCTYASAPSPLAGTNTATATWDQAVYFTPDGSATGTAPVDFSTPTKVVDGSVTVTDTLGGTVGTVSYTDPTPTTFMYPLSFSGVGGTCTNYTNTATFKTSDSSTIGSSSQTVKVCVGVDLTVSKTATPSFTRTYNWSIAKAVDKTLVKQVGGTATFNYTVTATETGFTDSGWQVNGTIMVKNPNDWEAITVNVGDIVDNGGACTVTGGTNVSVPASSSKTLNYTCSYTSQPAYNVTATNTATATWNSGAFFTPDGSASGSAGFAFSTPTTTSNKTITVTDTLNSVTTTLGLLMATDATPFTSKAFTYSHTVSVPTFGCKTYPNTAKIVETGQTASASVQVCGPVQTGALTMGYWQNKNGQAIITGANQAALGAWLGQYHPFSNAPSTGLATYVYNIIKAATCTSTTNTCNSMLRAQMLATALDVYFSDPGLGGNKISAPAAIGGVTIDLTNICHMIDGSGGTATCSGPFENVSSAFGGATSMTVLQMLKYQNTADPLADAGAVWYGQVKATQVLAKDAFDAINNQVAFSP